MTTHQLTASFRDPSGFIFTRNGVIYRQINFLYQADYKKLMDSGLYQTLVNAGLLVPHQKVAILPENPDQAYQIIQPEPIPFISYPYEWSFSQLKDAAQVTLAIQKYALEFGMSLKDASAYNIQFYQGRPILIDTLSFESYRKDAPWVAYRQFCQHFLAPLALMAYRDIRLSQLLRVYIDGIPLDLAKSLLPFHTRFSLPLLLHIHLHATAQKQYANKTNVKSISRPFKKTAFMGLVDNLDTAVSKLTWQSASTEWANYYAASNYTDRASQHKAELVQTFLDKIQPCMVWDLGANIGRYSRLSSERGIPTLAFDIDPGAVERNYLECVANKETNLLPLVMDLTNPSSSLGWHHQERDSLLKRAPVDVVMALALIHHLAIANNVPLDHLAHFFSDMAKWLILEFVPKTDSQVQRMLATRDDIFPNYTSVDLEATFGKYFTITDQETIHESGRIMYLLQRIEL